MYTPITDAPMGFTTIFIRSLVEVHRSSAKSHGLFFPVFYSLDSFGLRIRGLSRLRAVHIIAPIGATFLSQRATQLKASSKHPRVESSTGDATQAPSSSDPFAEAYVDPTVVMDPPPSTLSASSLRAMLDTVRTI